MLSRFFCRGLAPPPARAAAGALRALPVACKTTHDALSARIADFEAQLPKFLVCRNAS